jgi:hypothetical protein
MSDTETLIETVAKAIHEVGGRVSVDVWNVYARAAIRAIEESPTHQIVTLGATTVNTVRIDPGGPPAGMSLRDYFAASCLRGLLNNESNPKDAEAFATDAYRFADAMLKVRERKT